MIRIDTRQRAVLTAFFVTLLWSSSWVIMRIGMDDEDLPPLTFAGLRYVAAALILGAVTAARPAARAEVRGISNAGMRRLALLGVVFYAVNQGAVFIAVDGLTVATTSLVLSLTPLLVTFASGRVLGEPPSSTLYIGALLVPIGSLAYLSGDLGATAVGLVAAVVALTANTVSTLMGRSVNRAAHTSPLVTTSVSMAVGAVLLLGTGLLVDDPVSLSAKAVVIILWLALVNTALAFTLWNLSLRHLGAGESAVINNTMLLQVALLGWIVLDEVPSALQWCGLVIVSTGIAISQWRRRNGGPIRTLVDDGGDESVRVDRVDDGGDRPGEARARPR